MSGMQKPPSITEAQAKSAAKAIKARLKSCGVDIGTGHAYEALAASLNFANWSTMKATIARQADTSDNRSENSDAIAYREVILGRVRAALQYAVEKGPHRYNSRYLEFSIREVTAPVFAQETRAMIEQSIFPDVFPDFWPARNGWHDTNEESAIAHVTRRLTEALKTDFAEAFATQVRGRLASSLWTALSALADAGVDEWRDKNTPYFVPTVVGHLWHSEISVDQFVQLGCAIAKSFRRGRTGLNQHVEDLALPDRPGFGVLPRYKKRYISPELKAKWDKYLDAQYLDVHVTMSALYNMLMHDPEVALGIFLKERDSVALGIHLQQFESVDFDDPVT